MIDISRFIAAALVLTVLVAGLGCQGGSATLSGSVGNIQIVLGGDTTLSAARDGDGGDDGGDACSRLQAAEVTFTSIVARNLEGQLIPLSLEYPVTVDLFALRENNSVALPLGTLPPGAYDQLVVVMSTLTLTTLNGTQIAISPPPGGWTRIIRVDPFEVIEGETTTVRIRFLRQLSFKLFGDRFSFDPHFEQDNG
jgi:hypothetical protein